MCEYFLTNNNIWISIMIEKLQNPDFRAMNNEVNSAGEALSKADISFAHQVLDKLNNDENEVLTFSKDPKAYIHNLGYEVPQGIDGIYYIDKNNVVHPHPHDKPSTGEGVRVVAEVYKEPGILGWCAICMGCVNM